MIFTSEPLDKLYSDLEINNSNVSRKEDIVYLYPSRLIYHKLQCLVGQGLWLPNAWLIQLRSGDGSLSVPIWGATHMSMCCQFLWNVLQWLGFTRFPFFIFPFLSHCWPLDISANAATHLSLAAQLCWTPGHSPASPDATIEATLHCYQGSAVGSTGQWRWLLLCSLYFPARCNATILRWLVHRGVG